MEIPFIGGAYTGRSTNANAQACQNLYPVADDKDGKSILYLMNTPGMLSFADTSAYGSRVRALLYWDDVLYAIVDDSLLSITSSGVVTEIGAGIILTSTSWIKMVCGQTQFMFIDGTYGYYCNGTTLTRITDTDFPQPSSLTYQDGYFIVTKYDDDTIWISGIDDASSWDGLDYASAEARPDNAIAVENVNRELWIFGKDSTEIFYNSGNADFPFERVSGGSFDIGCATARSIATAQSAVFWLDNVYSVRMARLGYQSQVISTPHIDYQIASYVDKTDVMSYCYTQEGHTFYLITFAGDSKTWVYDMTTSLWHTRSTGLSGARHYSNCYAFAYGKHIVGHRFDGKLYELNLNTYLDGSDDIMAVRAAQFVHSGRKNVFHHRLEIEFEAGIGLVSGQGSDPQAMLDWSDDGGHTWSNEHWADIGGAVGEYSKRAIWKKLGKSRNRVYRVSITDPVKRVILSAHLDATVGEH